MFEEIIFLFQLFIVLIISFIFTLILITCCTEYYRYRQVQRLSSIDHSYVINYNDGFTRTRRH